MNLCKMWVVFICLSIMTLASSSIAAEVDVPLFPLILNDENALVRFEVDSTWHMVHGETKNLHGQLWLENAADLSSVRGEVRLPVSAFDTDNAARDRKMRKVLAENEFPEVAFLLEKVAAGCPFNQLKVDQPCTTVIQGRLRIKETTRSIEIPVTLSDSAERITVRGKTELKWVDYGVEDPSILIARLNAVVTIYFELYLPRR